MEMPLLWSYSRRIHCQLLVVVAHDIRTGFDFAAVARQDYRNASTYLRSEWVFWRKVARHYGFGRTELAPIRTNAGSIGKYVAKHIGQRLPEDKGARLVRYSRGSNRVGTAFFCHAPGADLWRWNLGTLCMALGLTPENYTDRLREWYGKNWIRTLGPIVQSLKLARYPSFPALQRDYPALEIVPRAIFSQPDFDPFTGPWVNPHLEYAKKSLVAAWVTAVNERERCGKRRKTRGGFKAMATEPEIVSKAPQQWASWIERPFREEAA